MNDNEGGFVKRLRCSAEVYYIRGRGFVRSLIRLLGLALVSMGGLLLFIQYRAINPELGYEIVRTLAQFGVPVDVSWLLYMIAGLLVSWLSL